MKNKKNKGEKSIASTIIKSILFVIVLFVQILFFYLMYTGSKLLSTYFNVGFEILRLIAMITVIYNHDKSEYKLAWIILMTFLPVAGLSTYLIWGRTKPNKKMKLARNRSIERGHKYFDSDEDIYNIIKRNNKQIFKQIKYLHNVTGYPVYKNHKIEYFPTGEIYFEALIKDLKKAKKFILIEYFILAKGKLWDEIELVLKQKQKEGVKIKIIIDEWGTMLRRPRKFFEEAKHLGIETVRYNPIKYGINNYINYRNHRKIVVIDGVISYTGGVNIADEYINIEKKYGYWKDNGIKVIGDVSKSFMISFLKTLEISTKKEVDYKWYIDNTEKIDNKNIKDNGYVMFYSDGPDNRKNPAETAYINIINGATDYIYIFTPYLALGKELLEALLTSSRSGVDVKIITPYKADKWYMRVLTRSYYQVLLEAGIKIYEYTPGFLHGKTILVDDKSSIIGTINLDFRSLNLNYECAALTYISGVEEKIKKDFHETLDVSEEISLEDIKKRNIFTRILEAIVIALSPML